MADAKKAGNESEAAVWHKRLFYYLDWLFQRDSSAGAEFAVLQACLYVHALANCF